MNRTVKPITITAEQIVAAAQLIANKDDGAWEHTPEKYLAAVRSYLEAKMSDIISEADWHANKDNFSVNGKQTPSTMEEATELVLPEAPEWAHDKIAAKQHRKVNRAAAPLASHRECQIEPDGNILWA